MTLGIEVDGMQCEGCARTLRRELEDVDGLRVRGIDVDTDELVVDLDPEAVDREALFERLDEAGFPVREAERVETAPETKGPAARVVYGLLVLAVLVIGLVGYAGYELYPRFDLPVATGLPLLALAVGAGIASFFSPCAFSLLVTLLARRTGRGSDERGTRIARRPLAFAAAMSVGAALFVLLTGLVIAFGGEALVGGVTFTSVAGRILRLVVGLFLVLMGLMQFGLLPNPLHAVEEVLRPYFRLQAEQRRSHPLVGAGLFGFGYLLAGFG